MADKRDYYEVLGVAKGATDEEIKRAYRRKAKECHPDLHPDDKEAEARFKELNEANEVLSDPDKRARYDQFGFNDPMAGGNPFGGGSPFGGMDFGGMGGMGDILDQIFGGMGGMGGRARHNAPRQGADVETELLLEFHEACLGCKKTVMYTRRKKCATCNGSGAKPGSQPVSCAACGGRGQVVQTTPFGRFAQTCSACAGQGKVIKEKCTACSGRGAIRTRETQEVDIPAGIDEGRVLISRGKGDPGENGGPSGDLRIHFRVKPHQIFRRDGDNLFMEVPVTFTQAAMGAEFDVATLTGVRKIVVPEGTQPGTEFRLKGEGVVSVDTKRKGDLIYRVNVEIPRKLSDKQRELLQQFDSISSDKDYRASRGFLDKLKSMFTGN